MEGRPPRAYHRYRSNAQRKRQLRRRRFGALILAAAVLVVAVVIVVMTSAGGDPRVPSASAASPSPSVSTASPPAKASPSPSPSASRAPSWPPPLPAWSGPASPTLRLRLKKTLSGGLTAKSVVATDTGLVSAQNMIYMHTVSYFNSKTMRLVKTVSDTVRLSAYGYPQYSSPVRGGPVEAAVSADRRYEYISNYSMYGPGFSRPGDDVGGPGQYDRSFVYRINLRTLKIDQAIRVGAVPKFLATTPDGKYLLVSNWTSYSLSVVDVARHRQVREISLGPYPRGIAVDPQSRYAYVAVMGSTNIARVDLRSFKVGWLRGVGSGPRHLCMDPKGRWLYATLNGEGRVAKIDPRSGRVVAKVSTGQQPRSMAIAPDGKSLYLVNYVSNTVSKIRAADMKVIQVVRVGAMPIGITYDALTKTVWVSCYSGTIWVFADA